MPLNVRRARAGDEKTVASFLVKLVRQHVGYDPHRFSDFVTAEGAAAFYAGRFEAENARVLVAEIDGKPAGFAYLEFEERNYEELLDRGVWLHDIFVEEEFRSAGVGKALMKASIAAGAEWEVRSSFWEPPQETRQPGLFESSVQGDDDRDDAEPGQGMLNADVLTFQEL